MSDEKRRVVIFQAQPEGPGPFFRPVALSVADVARPHGAPSDLQGKKMDSAVAIKLVLAGPNMAVSS